MADLRRCKAKIFTIWPYKKKFANPRSRYCYLTAERDLLILQVSCVNPHRDVMNTEIALDVSAEKFDIKIGYTN